MLILSSFSFSSSAVDLFGLSRYTGARFPEWADVVRSGAGGGVGRFVPWLPYAASSYPDSVVVVIAVD